MAETAPNKMDSVIGRLVVEKGLATAEEVEDCKALSLHDVTSQSSLAELLVSNGLVTQRQLQRLRPQLEEKKPSQQIPGYQLLEKIGSGAMAAVFMARQLSLDRMVAIKVLPKSQTSKQEFVQRFYAEGRAAAKLNHPNIIQAIDVGRAGEYHYFVMEYVEGKTVFEVMAKGRKFTESDALKVIIQIAGALNHAHKAGLIHRDVKPKNIMLTGDGQAKLADMGLARGATDHDAAEAEHGRAYGTPYYISPEQVRGDLDVDFRADIYSLGATFYHIVTGQVPFDGPGPSAVMHKHLKAKLVPPKEINPGLSTGVGEIIEVCMAKNREERYSNTTDLLHDLEAVLRGDPPLEARSRFDRKRQAGKGRMGGTQRKGWLNSMARQPLFWVALSGWIIAIGGLLAIMFRGK